MLGTQKRWQEDLFVAGPLSSLIPDDHILKQVDKVLDLSGLPKEVSDLYCQTNGRPSIDPEAAVRLMLAGFFQGIVHDRKLMREAQVNIAIRWFAGYRLDEKLPDHSSLTKIRQRWGAERFKQIFLKTVQSCIDANLVSGETVHVDATLIRADVSWESLTTEHVETVIKENASVEEGPKGRGRPKKQPKPKKRSTTDPDATMTTSSHTHRMEPFYKQHGAVDDTCGVVVDVDITTGQDSEGSQLPDQIERIESNIGGEIRTLSADAGYAHGKNYEHLEKKNIDAIIPPQSEHGKPRHLPTRCFKYDAKNKIVKCPVGKILTRRTENKQGWIYRATAHDCRNCSLRKRCISETSASRTIMISNGYEALLRARRRHREPDKKFRQTYSRHRWKIEGMHGEAKTQHGLRRAVHRGLANVAIQAYLTAAVINLKRLAAHAGGLYSDICDYLMNILAIAANRIDMKRFLANGDIKLLRVCYDRNGRCEG
ncbi:IS1182 family transposase ISMno17 [subsurface metagenome]